jgi:hypothetical protein
MTILCLSLSDVEIFKMVFQVIWIIVQYARLHIIFEHLQSQKRPCESAIQNSGALSQAF